MRIRTKAANKGALYAVTRVSTSITTTSASYVDATGLTVTFTVEPGDGPVILRAGCGRSSVTGGTYPAAYRIQITTSANVEVARATRTVTAALSESGIFAECYLDLAPGTYTYKVRHNVAGTSGTPTGYMTGEATNPAFIAALRG